MYTMPAMFGLPGGSEWFIILVVVLLIFGPKNLPKLGKAMGGFVTSFKAGQRGEELEEDEEEFDEQASESDHPAKS